ncbi:YceD family protein [Variovorax sp. PvP013]|uniref:YceD family protein n=1 Tax=Variovorax sp. PvP013 TaxID=3156435 RepID=UPI003D202502
MKRDAAPARLDVIDFAGNAAMLAGEEPLTGYPRLAAEMEATEAPTSPVSDAPDAPDASDPPTVRWQATGERRTGATGAAEPWLHLQADAVLPLVCQRCLSTVDTELQVDRWFRFAPDEATAELEDENSEEDVLVAARDFDLRELIEDELLMDIPITPRHDVCPQPVQLSAVDPAFEEEGSERVNPFAVLGNLRPAKS